MSAYLSIPGLSLATRWHNLWFIGTKAVAASQTTNRCTEYCVRADNYIPIKRLFEWSVQFS